MDIIDVLVAKILSPQGQVESYAALAQEAVTKANTAVNNINAITEQTNSNNALSEETLANANSAIEAAQAAISAIEESGSTLDVAAVDDEVKKLTLTLSSVNNSNNIAREIKVKYPDNSTKTLSNVVKYYTSTGNNEDGTMTQKAITAALSNAGSGSGGSGSSIHIGTGNAGEFTIIDENGNVVASGISADEMMISLMKTGNFTFANTVGLQIDYLNNTVTRTQEAANYTMGNDFNKYPMYGGRARCNVADDGTITAFYGDEDFAEDGSNGQVMVYQPKFYYSRIPIAVENNAIQKELIILSPSAHPGFKLHPAFKNENGEEVDYILYSAYEGSTYDVSEGSYNLTDDANVDFNSDKLASISGAKPIASANKNITLENAEKLAANRGSGWHLSTLLTESANQFLQLVEYGTANSQEAVEAGIVDIQDAANKNCASITGSTSTIGNYTGAAAQTMNEKDGVYNTYTVAGRRAISYRGIENPWGNTWKYLSGAVVKGNGAANGGTLYLEKDGNEINTGIVLPNTIGYQSAFGYSFSFDYLFIPVASEGNDKTPIGDKAWIKENINETRALAYGGSWMSSTNSGMFCYAFDQRLDMGARTLNARLTYTPQVNNIYQNNILKWKNYMEV